MEYANAQSEMQFFKEAIELCMKGKVKEFSELLDRFISSNPTISIISLFESFEAEGKTFLHIAAASGHYEILQLILEKYGSICPSVNITDKDGFTPLINATISESSSMMKSFINLGADCNLRNKDGSCALHFAAGDGSIERISILCDAGAEINYLSKAGTPLHWAAGKGHVNTIRYLVERGATVDIFNSNNLSPIYLAAAASSDEGVAYLIEQGNATINSVSNDGATLLHVCAENGLVEAVRKILQKVEGKTLALTVTSDGNLPIHYAAMSKHTNIIEMLQPYSGDTIALQTTEDILKDGVVRLRQWEKKHRQSNNSNSNTTESGNSDRIADVDDAHDFNAIVSALLASTPANDDNINQANALKNEGNKLYDAKDFSNAISKYTEAIQLHNTNHILYSNRSAAYLLANEPTLALYDAEICRRLKSDWPRGCYRLATARLALGKYEDAAVAAFEGCKLDENNNEMKDLLRKAVKLGQDDFKKSNSR